MPTVPSACAFIDAPPHQSGRGARTMIIGMSTACSRAVLVDPSIMLLNPPRPRLPTTSSWPYSDWSSRARTGLSRATTRSTSTSG